MIAVGEIVDYMMCSYKFDNKSGSLTARAPCRGTGTTSESPDSRVHGDVNAQVRFIIHYNACGSSCVLEWTIVCYELLRYLLHTFLEGTVRVPDLCNNFSLSSFTKTGKKVVDLEIKNIYRLYIANKRTTGHCCGS